jgi:hypothetical protein
VPSSAGSRSATGAPLEADAHLIRTY